MTASEPSLVDSIVRVFEAGQQIIVDRVDLARFDLDRSGSRLMRGATLIAIGAVLVAGAWFALLAGGVVWLQQYLSLPASLAVGAGVSAGLGVGVVAVGLRRAQGDGELDLAGDLVGPLHGATATTRTDGVPRQ